MASGINAPQPSIFQDSALEQIYARGTLDRDMSGLSYMFLNAAQQNRGGSQDRYLVGLDVANKRAQEVAALEQAMKFRTARMGDTTKLALGGYGASGLVGSPDLFNDPASQDFVAKLDNDLTRAKIQQALTSGSGGGGAGGEQDTIKATYVPGMTTPVYDVTSKSKGGDPNKTLARQQAIIKQLSAVASSPNATPEQRKAAAAAVEQVRSRYPQGAVVD